MQRLHQAMSDHSFQWANQQKLPNRRSIRLQGYGYSQAGAYFITICTKDNHYWFGDIVDGQMVLNDRGKIVIDCWDDIPGHYDNVEIDEFVVMPNHVHGIVLIFEQEVGEHRVGAIQELPVIDNMCGAIRELPLQQSIQIPQQRRKMTLAKIVGRIKMVSAKQINILDHTTGVAFWQRNYYEHVIRNEESLQKTREYIVNNPINWQMDEMNDFGNA